MSKRPALFLVAWFVMGLGSSIARSADPAGASAPTTGDPATAAPIVTPAPQGEIVAPPALKAHNDSTASLPRISLRGDGGIWALIKATDTVVRSVMVILLLSSLSTWTVWFVTVVELVRGRRRLTHDVEALRKAESLSALPQFASEAVKRMVDAIRAELRRAADLRNHIAAEGLKERVPAHLLSVETAFGRRMSRTTVIIASVGATAPFIGLFGTVWGIMDSFIGITKTQSTNLASIAPGIAEALLTTALGLAAAIPAVLIYNGLARGITSYRALLADASNAAMCVLSLHVEQRQIGGAAERPVALRDATHGL